MSLTKSNWAYNGVITPGKAYYVNYNNDDSLNAPYNSFNNDRYYVKFR